EGVADDLSLALRVLHTGKPLEEEVGGIHDLQLHPHVAPEGPLDGLALARTQEPRIDEDVGELIADGAVHEGSGDAGIDATRKAADHLRVADPLADPCD